MLKQKQEQVQVCMGLGAAVSLQAWLCLFIDVSFHAKTCSLADHCAGTVWGHAIPLQVKSKG